MHTQEKRIKSKYVTLFQKLNVCVDKSEWLILFGIAQGILRNLLLEQLDQFNKDVLLFKWKMFSKTAEIFDDQTDNFSTKYILSF